MCTPARQTHPTTRIRSRSWARQFSTFPQPHPKRKELVKSHLFYHVMNAYVDFWIAQTRLTTSNCSWSWWIYVHFYAFNMSLWRSWSETYHINSRSTQFFNGCCPNLFFNFKYEPKTVHFQRRQSALNLTCCHLFEQSSLNCALCYNWCKAMLDITIRCALCCTEIVSELQYEIKYGTREPGVCWSWSRVGEHTIEWTDPTRHKVCADSECAISIGSAHDHE